VYSKTVLDNGIRVVTETIPEMRSVAMGFLVDVGPCDETPDQRGLAHLVEHLMFQGTSSRDAMQIARLMDSSGGQMGAFTAKDYTCYFATVLDDYRTYVLDLMGDILLNSTFPPEKLEREKSAILREIDAGYDAPDEHVHTLLKNFIWKDHPLGQPVAGQPETVKEFTREDVIYFVHQHYQPDRLIVAAAGNVEHDDFVAQVRDAFWRMLGQSLPRVRTEPVYHAGIQIKHLPVSQAYFSIGLRALPYLHQDRYGLHILNNIIGGGISSRLFRRIREEQGLVYNIGTEYHAYRDGGLLVVEGSTTPECLMSVLALTLVELWQLATGEEPVDDDELWKAKMHIRGHHLIESENTNSCMSRLATQEFYFGQHIPADEILAQIESVDGSKLQQLASDTLVDALSNVTIAIVGPETEHYSISSVTELLASFDINGET
jgi:predicted Zn-dependent peptidase